MKTSILRFSEESSDLSRDNISLLSVIFRWKNKSDQVLTPYRSKDLTIFASKNQETLITTEEKAIFSPPFSLWNVFKTLPRHRKLLKSPSYQSNNLKIMAKFTVNELLCFLSFYGDKLDRNSLLTIIAECYTHDEAVTAKHLLFSECEILGLSNGITDFKKKRLNTKGDALQKVTKDILDIWEVIDCQKGGVTKSTFVASDPSRLPSVEAEKIHINGLTSIVFQLQHQVSTITKIVIRIDKRVDASIADKPALNDSICSYDQPPFSPRSLPVTPANTEEDINSALCRSSRRHIRSAKQRLNSW